MPFEAIVNIAPPKTSKIAVPADGVLVRGRKIEFKRGKRPAHWIEILIGPQLAQKLCIDKLELCRLQIMFGTGVDAGKIAITLDAKHGFEATRTKTGNHRVTVNQHSCAGLFALSFDTFTVPAVRVEHAHAKPPLAVFKASEAMLKAED